MSKRKHRRRGRRFHWLTADHYARLRHLLDEGRFKDHDHYLRLYQLDLRAVEKGGEPWPTDHPLFVEPFLKTPPARGRCATSSSHAR